MSRHDVGTQGRCYEAVYPEGWQVTMLRLRELVDEEYNVKYSAIVRLDELLTPALVVSSNSGDSII